MASLQSGLVGAAAAALVLSLGGTAHAATSDGPTWCDEHPDSCTGAPPSTGGAHSPSPPARPAAPRPRPTVAAPPAPVLPAPAPAPGDPGGADPGIPLPGVRFSIEIDPSTTVPGGHVSLVSFHGCDDASDPLAVSPAFSRSVPFRHADGRRLLAGATVSPDVDPGSYAVDEQCHGRTVGSGRLRVVPLTSLATGGGWGGTQQSLVPAVPADDLAAPLGWALTGAAGALGARTLLRRRPSGKAARG